jgi:hypothetical protein
MTIPKKELHGHTTFLSIISPHASWRKAAKHGCYICERLWRALLPQERDLIRSTSWITGMDRRMECLKWLYLFESRCCYGWNAHAALDRLDFAFGACFGSKVVTFDLLHADGGSINSFL